MKSVSIALLVTSVIIAGVIGIWFQSRRFSSSSHDAISVTDTSSSDWTRMKECAAEADKLISGFGLDQYTDSRTLNNRQKLLRGRPTRGSNPCPCAGAVRRLQRLGRL